MTQNNPEYSTSKFIRVGRGAVAQSVEHPSNFKVPGATLLTDAGSNHERDMSSHLSDHGLRW